MAERAPGVWRLRVYLGRDEHGRPMQTQSTFKGTQKQATKALAVLVTKAGEGRFDRTRATVGELIDKWLENLEALGRRPSTLVGYRRKIEQPGGIRVELGSVPLAKLGADDLDGFYRTLGRKGKAPATIRQHHAILAASLHQAVKWGWIDRNPAERATPPSVHAPAMKVPTPEQLSALLTAAEDEDPVLATAIALAALTGARRGELCALRWSDIDLELGRVRIARSLTVADGQHHEGPTKTHAVRTVALDDLGVEVLRRRHTFMVDLAAWAESPLVDDPYVLSYNANAALPVNPDTFTHRFGALCRAQERAAAKRRRVKVGKLPADELWPFRFHDLRHFSVTTLIAAGVDVRTVAERHGHAQATMTLNRYAHALPERDREAAGVLGRALRAG